MAKKIDPSELTVEQKLKALYQLQATLSEIDRIKTLRGELPLEVQDLEDEIEGLRTRASKFAEDIEAAHQDIADKQQRIADAEKLSERYKEQINNVRNNREFDMLTKELEFQTLEIKLQEKRIGEAEKFIAERQASMEASQKMASERQEDLEAKKAELDTIISETKSEEDKLREKAKGYEAQIEPRLLTAFKRIRKNSRNGLGVVYVQRDACGGCFNKIPPQRQLDVRMRKKIIVCEYCGRILVDPELAGVKPIVAKEEKPKRKRSSKTTKKPKTETE